MARINSLAGNQEVAFDDAQAGEGLAIFFSQGGMATVRYRFVVKAIIDSGTYDVGEFYSSPPGATSNPGMLSRMIAGAVCPGATSWRVAVSAVPSDDEDIASETADIVLASSKCYTSPVGLSRVGERYDYLSRVDVGPGGLFVILPGMKVTGIAALGLTGGGSMQLGSGPLITVPDGVSINLEPRTIFAPNTIITLNNVNSVIEYLESA